MTPRGQKQPLALQMTAELGGLEQLVAISEFSWGRWKGGYGARVQRSGMRDARLWVAWSLAGGCYRAEGQ